MCQYFVDIAQLDDYRLVGQCEHATISLTWWHCTWHLQPRDFLLLGELLQVGEGQNQCFVLDRYPEKAVLWCGDACLVLRGERFEEFATLIGLALPQIETDPERAYRKASRSRAGLFESRLLN